jgi:hypothetical protein
MDIKRVIFESGKEHLSLDVSSANIDTLGPSLCQGVEPRRIEVFLIVVLATSTPPFQPLPSSAKRLSPRLNRFTRQTLSTVIRKHFFINTFLR